MTHINLYQIECFLLIEHSRFCTFLSINLSKNVHVNPIMLDILDICIKICECKIVKSDFSNSCIFCFILVQMGYIFLYVAKLASGLRIFSLEIL